MSCTPGPITIELGTDVAVTLEAGSQLVPLRDRLVTTIIQNDPTSCGDVDGVLLQGLTGILYNGAYAHTGVITYGV